MSRYIDADALKIPSEEIIAKMIINSAPSIDIVRCRDRKYYEAKEDWCCWRDEYTEPEYFCSYGEVCDEFHR